MALLGGGVGGAGNPVGGSFTGPAQALEIYGDFAAAYSGPLQIASGSAVEHLNFTTGNYLFLGSLTLSGPMDIATPADGAASVAEISFNGVVIFKLKVETDQEDMPTEVSIPLLIPAYTEVDAEVNSNDSSAGLTTSINVIGKIYRD